MTGLCILKPENVSPSCRDIIVSVLWEMNFYFQLLRVHVFTFGGKKLGWSFPMLRLYNQDYPAASFLFLNGVYGSDGFK